jgi:glutathione synthase/RimK-type ligase-like ATP-grasp enzyme
MILAIGNSRAYEVDSFRLVLERLRQAGHDAVLFKQDKCLNGEYLIFEIIDGRMIYSIVIDGVAYNVDEFSAIWYMKPQLPIELLRFKPVEYRQFIDRQFNAMRTALWSIFGQKKWINDPWSIQIAENKLYQLSIAAEKGFNVPETLVTSDPEKIKSFYKNHNGNIVVKLLSASPIIDHVIYTNKVTSEYLEKIESVKMSPSIFQDCIEKAYELRITVVGDKIFPVRIFSQVDESTSLDWRMKPKLNDFEVKMEETVLPEDIVSKIKSLMDKLNLRFGCIDMIVTSKGRYVFLEINPNGQWYFVQLRSGAKIAEAIADLLV